MKKSRKSGKAGSLQEAAEMVQFHPCASQVPFPNTEKLPFFSIISKQEMELSCY